MCADVRIDMCVDTREAVPDDRLPMRHTRSQHISHDNILVILAHVSYYGILVNIARISYYDIMVIIEQQSSQQMSHYDTSLNIAVIAAYQSIVAYESLFIGPWVSWALVRDRRGCLSCRGQGD